MRKFFALVVVFASCVGALAQTRFSILGDSYSTFEGYVTPSYNAVWYSSSQEKNHPKNNVRTVDQTWWKLLDEDLDYRLDVNNSYSGSTVCLTGYNKKDCSDRAFITRLMNLGNPDIIIVFGGTNDSWANSPIGEYQFSDWGKEDLYSFRPAFAYMLDNLQILYPDKKIIVLMNQGLKEEIIDSMKKICQHYKIQSVQLYSLDLQEGHPSVNGMMTIYKEIKAALSME